MKKNFKTVKTSIVFGLLLVSLFAVFTSNASAIKINAALKVEFDAKDIQQEVIPASQSVAIGLNIFYQYYGVGASYVSESSLLAGTPAFVDLKIVSSPEWCTAVITPPIVVLTGGASFSDPASSAIILSVNENAPAFFQGTVRVAAHSTEISGGLWTIKEQTLEVDVPFQVGYSPAISFETPQGTYMQIAPLDTAEFAILVENLGNAQTEVLCRVLDVPKGWSANLITSVVLDSNALGGTNTEKTIYFKVKPPYGFGYHSERETISIELTPYYYRNPSLVGKTYQIDFVIESRGFSVPGFEIPLMAIALIGIALICKVKKKRQ